MNNVKLEFNFASMNSGKSLSLITKHYMLKERGFKVVAVKPQLDTRSEKIQTRLGVEIDCFNIGKYDKVSDVILKSNKSSSQICTLTSLPKTKLILLGEIPLPGRLNVKSLTNPDSANLIQKTVILTITSKQQNHKRKH